MNPSSLARIEQGALRLPEPEHAALAERLIESLDFPADDDAETAWAVEIARRLEEINQGKVALVNWEDARRTIRESRLRGSFN